MSDVPLYLMAMLTGFLGSGHCIGMCGGIVCALSISAKGRQAGFIFHLLYNFGRLITYGFIGMLVGWLGSLMAYSTAFDGAARFVLLASDVFLILIGLGSAGAFNKLNLMRLEFAGPVKALTGLVKKLHLLPAYASALPLGLVFGFLPCGFLYAMAITAAQTTGVISGMLVMISFGLGTVPALFAFASIAHLIGSRARKSMLRWAGIMIMLMGLLNLARHLHIFGFLPGGSAACLC